jgi:hypothetical protein
MSHAKSLRVLGRKLDVEQVSTFKLEKCADSYRLWLSKGLFSFDRADIARLNAKALKGRANRRTATRQLVSVSQQLRVLGGYLDRIEVRAFNIVWTSGSAILEYEGVNGERNSRVFTAEELRQVGLHRSRLRSSRQLLKAIA